MGIHTDATQHMKIPGVDESPASEVALVVAEDGVEDAADHLAPAGGREQGMNNPRLTGFRYQQMQEDAPIFTTSAGKLWPRFSDLGS